LTEKRSLTGNIQAEKLDSPDTARLCCDMGKAGLCHVKIFVGPWLICPQKFILLCYKLRAGTTKSLSQSLANDPTTTEGEAPGQSLNPKTCFPNNGRFV